jgi:hypothetical protein
LLNTGDKPFFLISVTEENAKIIENRIERKSNLSPYFIESITATSKLMPISQNQNQIEATIDK